MSQGLPQPPELLALIQAAVPDARLEVVDNPSPSGPASLVVDPDHALEVARFLQREPALQFDYCSNVTGVDWLDRDVPQQVRRTEAVDGTDREVVETVQVHQPGFIEVVYHLYSMRLRHGPVVLRQRTRNRVEQNEVASLTPAYRSAEFQEREVFDLFGVRFRGHPDLRRLLMWEGFADHPMRKDYVEPDDYEYEPTPHDEVVTKSRRHYPLPGQP
ncbi:MAG: NADH-quinone oxidoreductase subunit C [Verrucomicrobiales bacterium]|nr:NADH-quinone oxidoreductase subunit C [Verrucomicrobiales bacterium]